MKVTVFGIRNCDTINKARRWLEQHGVEYEFHDYRRQGLDPALLASMESALGWEAMINRRGTTWRGLTEAQKQRIDRESALRLMGDNPSLIKRPILCRDGAFYLGFDDRMYREVLNRHD